MAVEALIEFAAQPKRDPQVRKLIRMGLERQAADLASYADTGHAAFIAQMAAQPLGGSADANRQHYEVPPAFFETVLGPHLKYSCCLFEEDTATLADAERAMLDAVIARAAIADGQRILDLGCGWGALSLALARRFPNARITALSGASEQRGFIQRTAAAAGHRNIEVVTADIGSWSGAGSFDRIVSVEMFEHVRNWPALLRKVGGWLADGGRLFVHVFCHARACYFFEDDVTAQHFFTGGLMPAQDLLPRVAGGLALLGQWAVSGAHYQRTAEAWLANLDARAETARAALGTGDDPRPVDEQIAAWRLFFMITAESFGFMQGREWLVGHYLLGKS